MEIALKFLLVLFLVAANGFFVAAEFALVSVRRSQIEDLAGGGNRRARGLLRLLGDLNKYISATQLGITLASLGLGWIGEPFVASLLERILPESVSEAVRHTIAFAVGFSAITFLHIVFGELAPKTLALSRAEGVSLSVTPLLKGFYLVFQWPIRLLDWSGNMAVRLFGLTPSKDHHASFSETEVRSIIKSSSESWELDADEQQIIDRVFDFSDSDIREAMVPRPKVHALPVTSTLKEVTDAFRSLNYSRMPVYRERFDEIVGVISLKQLIPYLLDQKSHQNFSLERLASERKPLFIPSTTGLGKAFKDMQTNRTHFAFVFDEHGGVEGIITLEDLLEEIVGEIDDEYDEETHNQIAEQDDGSYILDGELAVRDANRQLNLNLPEDEVYSTIAGFLLDQFEELPERERDTEYEGSKFKVLEVANRRIEKVLLIPAPPVTYDEETDSYDAPTEVPTIIEK